MINITRNFFLKTLIALLLLAFSILSIYYNKTFIVEKLREVLPIGIKSVAKIILSNEINTKRMNNDYNTKFLPETQFLNLDFIKLKTNINNPNISGYAGFLKNKTKSFYIDTYKNNLFLFYKNGDGYYAEIDKLKESKIILKKIKNNLKNISITDILINNDIIYLAGSLKIKDGCNKFTVYESALDFTKVKFTKIFQDSNCYGHVQAGRIQYHQKENSIFVSTAADILGNKDQSDKKPQNLDSLMGKIVKIDLENVKNYEIYSLGHRNVIGMHINDNIILATENGPRGGDEINLIKKGNNYGWPISSYGEKYRTPNQDEPFYKKSHQDFNYAEPIYSFIPSIGISEIIKIGSNFSKQWRDSFLIASLNSRSIYRINFNKEYSKVKFIEKIFIGERIRDLKYYDNLIFLALEESNSIGILKFQ